MIQLRPGRNRGYLLKSKEMKYLFFLVGLYMACNEAFDLQTAFIGLGLMGLSGVFIIDKINKAVKDR